MPVTDRITGLILAAGYSSRMGTLKALLSFGAMTALEQAVDRLRRGGVADVRVIIGHAGKQIRTYLPELPVQWIENTHYERGMLSSVLTGVASLRNEAEGFLLLPVDIPLVSPETISALLTAWRQSAARVIYPVFQQRRGHPVLIALSCIPANASWDTPGGLGTLLQESREHALDVPVKDEAVLLDCDTPEDYILLLQRHCQVPDDCIGLNMGPLLRAREVMKRLMALSVTEGAQ
jgi:molybdenum cofactor cytidylyltransferase